MEPTIDAPSPVAGADRSSSLTRVTIDQALLDSVLLEPEPAVSWYRHEVRRLFLLHLLASIAVITGAATAAAVAFGRAPVEAVVVGALLGVVLATVWTLLILFVVPLTVRQVRRLVGSNAAWVRMRAAPVATASTSSAATSDRASGAAGGAPDRRNPLPDVWDLGDETVTEAVDEHTAAPRTDPVAVPVAVPLTADPGPSDRLVERCRRAIETAHDLVELGFVPVATLRTDGRPTRMVDVYREGDRVVAAIDRASGELTVLTELVGLRVLVTSAWAIPPTDELVVNVVAPDTPTALVVSHQRLVTLALSSRTLAGDPIGLFKLADQRRIEGYRGLGPWWAAALDRRARTGRPRLAAAPSPGEVLLFTGNRLFRRSR